MTPTDPIPGTIKFDDPLSTHGYPLNKMCYSFNDAATRPRAEFKADGAAYCDKFGLSPEQKGAILKRVTSQAMRGALIGEVTELHRNYHIPVSNTGAGLQLIENRAPERV